MDEGPKCLLPPSLGIDQPQTSAAKSELEEFTRHEVQHKFKPPSTLVQGTSSSTREPPKQRPANSDSHQASKLACSSDLLFLELIRSILSTEKFTMSSRERAGCRLSILCKE